MIQLTQANALHIPLPDESVHMVATSPPYWGLRDYGTAEWEGGDEGCDHVERNARNDGGRQGIDGFAGSANREGHADMGAKYYRTFCRRCGARRIDAQLGLEATPEEYVANMVAVFREVWRVLRPDGTVWLNLGDSYAASSNSGGTNSFQPVGPMFKASRRAPPGLKPKDLCGIPWRVAFALQADGWWLRSDVIWHKPNPMPGSQQDRPTSSHEYVFLLAKSARYYYDNDAVREPNSETSRTGGTYRNEWKYAQIKNTDKSAMRVGIPIPRNGRTLRDVWTIATQSYSGAHFATYPEALVEPCIKAGTSAKGCCPRCGTGWVREVAKERTFESGSGRAGNLPAGKNGRNLQGGGETLDVRRGPTVHSTTIGWRPGCTCCQECDIIGASSLSGVYDATQRQRGREGMAARMESTPMAEQPGASSKVRSQETEVREDLRTVQSGIQREEVAEVLLPEVCDRLAMGKRQGESVHVGCNTQVQTCAPGERAEDQGAPSCDGEPSGAGTGTVGVGTSHQWDSGRQQDREPCRSDECETREDPHEERFGHKLTPFEPVPAIVLDPFCGSGTTAIVARRLGRHAIGLDLSHAYLHDQARTRLELDKLAAWQGASRQDNGHEPHEDLPLFAPTTCEGE